MEETKRAVVDVIDALEVPQAAARWADRQGRGTDIAQQERSVERLEDLHG